MMFKQHVHEVITFFFFFFSFFFFLSFSSTPSPSSSLRWPSSIPSGNACAPPAGQEISLQPKQQHFPSFQPKLDMLKSQSSTHTSQFRGQFFCCFKLFLGLSRQKKAMIICVFVHIYIYGMHTVSVSISPCQHLHLSFYLHQNLVLQFHHLQRMRKSSNTASTS